jgi:hypothetical protein
MRTDCLSFLISLDFMSPPVHLNVNGTRGIKTWAGFTMTILFFATIFTTTYLILQTYFDRLNPQIVQQTTEDAVYPRIDLLKANSLPAVFLADKDFDPISADLFPKYFTIRYYKRIHKTFAALEYYDMPVVPCKDVLSTGSSDKGYYQQFIETSEFFRERYYGHGYCAKIDPQLMTVDGGGAQLFQSDLILELLPCTLATGCATKAELQEISVITLLPVASLNLSNFDTPVSNSLRHDNMYTISTGNLQAFKYKFTTTHIYDESRLFASLSKRADLHALTTPRTNNADRDSLQLSCTALSISTKQCTPYLRFEYSSSGSETNINRTYKGLLKTLSEIGGIVSFSYVFFFYLTLFYVRHAKRKILVGLVFDFIYSDEKILKGTEDPKAQQVYLEKEAYKVIESRLDIVTIVREINKLKVLSHMFLKDYHRKMVPLVSLSLHLQDKTNRGLSRKLSSIFAGINVISKKYIPPQQRNRRKDDQEDSEGDNNYGTPFENVKNSIRQMVKNKKTTNSASRIAVPNSSMEMDLESRVDAYFQSKLQNSAEIFSIPQDLISHKTFVQGGNEQSPINSQQQPIVIQMKSPLKQVSQDARYEISTNSTGKLIGKPSLRPVTANTLAKTKIADSPKHFEEIKSQSPLVNQREWIVSQNLIHPESVYPSSTPQQLPLSLNSEEQMTQLVSSKRRGLVDKGVEEVQTHTVGDGREDQGVHLSASHGLPNDTRSPSRFQPDHHIHRSVRHLN